MKRSDMNIELNLIGEAKIRELLRSGQWEDDVQLMVCTNYLLR